MLPLKCTKETRLQTLQWKLLQNIYPTAILLCKMGIRDNINCLKCNVPEFSEHFFFSCQENKELWDEVINLINAKYGYWIELTKQSVLTGFFSAEMRKQVIEEINFIILISKMVISKVKYGKRRNMVALLQEELYNRNIKI